MHEEEEIAILLARQLTGEVSNEERQRTDAWRKASPSNEEAYRRLTDRARLSTELERLRLTDYQRPLAEMRHRTGTDRRAAAPRTHRWMAAAAAVILIIGGATVLLNRHEGARDEQTVVETTIQHGHTQATLTRTDGTTLRLTTEDDFDKQQRAESQDAAERTSHEKGLTALNNLSTPRGGEFKVTLEDGTEVWLNAETTLRYPETFGSEERCVEVEGEAYFKVAHDASRPFRVTSGTQEVEVVGTEFNVNGYADDTDIRTTLVEGSIALRSVGGNGSRLMLSPGSQAVFDKHEQRASVRMVDTEMVTSWRSGTIVFEDQTLEQIMRTLSRWYDFEYQFTSPQLASTVLMGSIPRYGTFSEVAAIFEKMGGIRLQQKGGKVIISE